MLTTLTFLLALSPFAPPAAQPTLELAPPPAHAEPTAEIHPAPEAAQPPSEPTPPEPTPHEEPAPEATPALSLAEVEAEHQTHEDPEPFELQPPSPESSGLGPNGRRRRSPVWGQLWLSASILAGLDNFGLGVGAVRFVLPRLGFGLDLEDMIVFDRGAYNVFQATPKAVFLLLPNRRVTPIASAGFGGAFFSHRLGVYGRWTAGAGLMIAIGERLRTGFGLDFEGLLPESRFYHHFECRAGGHGCHIGLAPWIAFGFRG